MSPRGGRHGERGAGLVVVLAFIALAIPITTSALSLVSTAALDSRAKTESSFSRYAAVSGTEYGRYRLLHEPGFRDTVLGGAPVQQTIMINGQPTVITWERLTGPSVTLPGPGLPTLQTSKTVNPDAVPAGTPTLVTYDVTITNTGAQTERVRTVDDALPPFFTYEPGSTSGAATADPVITLLTDAVTGATSQQLEWALPGDGVDIAPASAMALRFQAVVNAPAGHYCNRAWTDHGGTSFGSGPTAVVTAGSLPPGPCDGSILNVRKTVSPTIAQTGISTTYTYTVTVQNPGPEVQDMTWIRDLLPTGLTYVTGSTSGDITSDDAALINFGGQPWLAWTGFGSARRLDPGQTGTLVFQASGALPAGVYYNGVWVRLQGPAGSAYSGPVAEITALDGFRVTAADGAATSRTRIFITQAGDYTADGWDLEDD